MRYEHMDDVSLLRYIHRYNEFVMRRSCIRSSLRLAPNKFEITTIYQIKSVLSHNIQEGRTPLVLASNNGRNEVIDLLLDHGANIDFPNTVCTIATAFES